ncbi:MAG: alpha-amylase [Chitinophagales bacterium]|nr:alpha-amylase [Chitinophagales bacterium]
MKKILFLLFLLPVIPLSAKLSIEKVEPPNWWVGMKWNTVQIMVYGEELQNLQASFDNSAIKVNKIHEVENTDYAFIDVSIPQDLEAGNYRLTLKSGKDKAWVGFPVLDRGNNSNNHKGFSNQDIVYLITPDRFANGNPSNDRELDVAEFNPGDPASRHGGDIQGMIDHLDYVKDLGFTAIWPNPLLENNQKGAYHGYAWTDLYKVDKRFGTNTLFKKFVQEAHANGIKIIFDHINNHIGIGHPWMQNLPQEDWINGTVENHFNDKHHMITMRDPHRAESTMEEFKTFWFVDAMPDVNQNNPFVSKYYIQNSIWWIEYSGVDGIREDTYPYGFQEHSTNWAKAIKEEYPNFTIVGETWLLEPTFLATFQDIPGDETEGTYLESLMDFPLMHTLRDFIKGTADMYEIYMSYAMDFVYPNPDNLMVMMDNHDESRALFIAKGNDSRVKIALQLVMTTRGIPQLLYGTEINMIGGSSHVLLRQDFPGGFPYHKRSAFHAEGRTSDEQQMHTYVKKLITLRKKHNALADGKFIHYPPEWSNRNLYVYFKIKDGEKIMGIVNASDSEMNVDLKPFHECIGKSTVLENLFTNVKTKIGKDPLIINAESATLFLLK